MAPVIVDASRVHEFADAASFERWLSKHHATEPEVWIKIHKVGSGLPSINAKEAIDVVPCRGRIDANRKIETFVAMLKRGETIYPQGRKRPPGP